MRGSRTSPVRRWLLIASVIFGLFVVFQLGLFSWMIFRTLSQREVDRILLATRRDASALAQELAATAETSDRDLFTAVAVSRKTSTFVGSMLLQQDIVEELEVTDSDGIVVFRTQSRTVVPERHQALEGLIPGEIPSGRDVHREREETSKSWEIKERIGDLGYLLIKVDHQEMARRVGELRGDLIRTSALIGGATVVMLLAAFLGVWSLLKRAQRLEDQTARSERMAYVGTLAAGLAHEIRNPLNSLSLNMQMLEEELEEEGSSLSTQRRLLSITRSEIERLGHLATDFLSFSRNRPLERSTVRAVRLLEEAQSVMGRELESREVEFRVRDESAGACVEVDPDQIRQLLLNLLNNALAAVQEMDSGASIELACRVAGGQVILEVIDNGRGMSEEERSKMFELFYSTRKGGTGLGLAIVERIAQAHDGRLEVESEVGRGTTVRLLLPRTAARPAEEPAAIPHRESEVPLESTG